MAEKNQSSNPELEILGLVLGPSEKSLNINLDSSSDSDDPIKLEDSIKSDDSIKLEDKSEHKEVSSVYQSDKLEHKDSKLSDPNEPIEHKEKLPVSDKQKKKKNVKFSDPISNSLDVVLGSSEKLDLHVDKPASDTDLLVNKSSPHESGTKSKPESEYKSNTAKNSKSENESEYKSNTTNKIENESAI